MTANAGQRSPGRAGAKWTVSEMAAELSGAVEACLAFSLSRNATNIARSNFRWKGRGTPLVRPHRAATPFYLVQAGELVGRQDLPLRDGEVDLDLIEPAGVGRLWTTISFAWAPISRLTEAAPRATSRYPRPRRCDRPSETAPGP